MFLLPESSCLFLNTHMYQWMSQAPDSSVFPASQAALLEHCPLEPSITHTGEFPFIAKRMQLSILCVKCGPGFWASRDVKAMWPTLTSQSSGQNMHVSLWFQPVREVSLLRLGSRVLLSIKKSEGSMLGRSVDQCDGLFVSRGRGAEAAVQRGWQGEEHCRAEGGLGEAASSLPHAVPAGLQSHHEWLCTCMGCLVSTSISYCICWLKYIPLKNILWNTCCI